MIHVITTGGTIGGLDSDLNKDASINIRRFLEAANLSTSFTIEKFLHKDSRDITEEDQCELSSKNQSFSIRTNLNHSRHLYDGKDSKLSWTSQFEENHCPGRIFYFRFLPSFGCTS
ncbi:hypothetical protein SAMN05444483_11446 [Salegentibacter echinorum]|uniref:Asparaginase n=1 Tax=Salegentibacter echinorum TaxID=1073325 RepID=A0A1M5KEE4_SALEC|nr:hypothetical protein SAMN05444483_11446 [Salegentibacter echinorum]